MGQNTDPPPRGWAGRPGPRGPPGTGSVKRSLLPIFIHPIVLPATVLQFTENLPSGPSHWLSFHCLSGSPQWELAKLRPHFTISPTEGFVQAHNEVALEVTFMPTAAGITALAEHVPSGPL